MDLRSEASANANGYAPNDAGATKQEAAEERVAKLADRLAPVEEQAELAAGIAPQKFKFSKVFADEGVPLSKALRPHPTVLIILGVVLGFIGFIAYLISNMPTE